LHDNVPPRLKSGRWADNTDLTSTFFAPLVAGLVACCALVNISGQSVSHASAKAHGYYLFLDRPRDGSDPCYVPLLVTTTRLEDLSKQKKDDAAIPIKLRNSSTAFGPLFDRLPNNRLQPIVIHILFQFTSKW
jgi:hypothetical protein